MHLDFKYTKSLFSLPDNIIYLDGNSLGPPTKATAKSVETFIKQKWAKLLIRGWNSDEWINKPKHVGNRIARLIGAQKDSVIVGDTLSIKTFQALFSALNLQQKRKIILSDKSNFPSDLYIAKGLIKTLRSDCKLHLVETEEVLGTLTDDIAVLFLTEVDYRTGRKHDMKKLTRRAKELGIVTVWDLAHSTGVLPVKLKEWEVDFAVGCTYKYLNGGPGSPAFLYVAPKNIKTTDNIIKGWLGHSSPFSFNDEYFPAKGIERMQIGTPPVIAIKSLEASLDILDTIDVRCIREQSIKLTELFISETMKNCPMLELASPRDPEERGAHVAFHFEHGYAVIQCLIENGVIGDFRMPNLMRFGINPLFIDGNDVLTASKILTDIMENKKWDKAYFKSKSFVT